MTLLPRRLSLSIAQLSGSANSAARRSATSKHRQQSIVRWTRAAPQPEILTSGVDVRVHGVGHTPDSGRRVRRTTIHSMEAIEREPFGTDPEFDRRSQIAQRIGWIALLVVVVAGMLGLFGEGLLSGAVATSMDGRVEVEHQRMLRRGASSPISILVHTEPWWRTLEIQIQRTGEISIIESQTDTSIDAPSRP